MMFRCKMGLKALLYSMQLAVLVFVTHAAAEDFSASSCSANDIESAINSAISSGGGTVVLPECNAFDTWKSEDKVEVTPGDAEIRVIGQGPEKTKIGYAAGEQKGIMFKFRGPGLKEFGGMHLKGDGYSGGSGKIFLVLHATENARIHHIVTENFAGPTGSLCATKNVVFDHCTFGMVRYGGTYQWYVFGDNNYSTDWTANFGTNNYNVFFEDCVFKDSHHPVSTFTAGSAVIRHSTLTFDLSDSHYTSVIDCHSCCYGDCAGDQEPYNWDFPIDRAGRAYEIYNNTMTYTGSGKFGYFARIRAGSVLFTGNTVSAPNGVVGQAIQLVCETNNNGPQCTSEYGFPVDYTYADGCNGETDGCCDKVETSFIWNNTMTHVKNELTIHEPCGVGSIAENKEYFMQAPNLSQNGFEWTPYTYPHPLVAGNTPEVPKNLEVIDD